MPTRKRAGTREACRLDERSDMPVTTSSMHDRRMATRAPIDVEAYLRRIGLATRPPADLEGLAELQLAHLLTVPFENLDIVAGRPIRLDRGALEAKIVGAHRGGFCYELNGLFAELAAAFGFAVSRLAAQVWSDETGWGIPFDHLVLRVDLDDSYLVDVGFGDSFRAPLALAEGAEQPDVGGGRFGLSRDAHDRWLLWKTHPGTTVRTPLFRFRDRAYALADFADACDWQQQESPFFSAHRIVELLTPDGRVVLLDQRLIQHDRGERAERVIDEADVPALLRARFGLSA